MPLMRRSTPVMPVLPDAASEASRAPATLEWVGMHAVEMPVLLSSPQGPLRLPARVRAGVNLKRADARGIHMSRLYLHLDRVLGQEPLSARSLHELLRDFLESHADLSDCAEVEIATQLLLRRAALLSDRAGWRSYPLHLRASHERGHYAIEMGLEVLYSSTCPSSAALARQAVQQDFERRFGASSRVDAAAVQAWLGSSEGMGATPHAQRSRMQVRLRLHPGFEELPYVALIDAIEAVLKTPVQSAVKREDEQAFARLNGENLMFCEDAARRVKRLLDEDARVLDYWLRASHLESLHPHDAVAVACKALPGGFEARSGWYES